MSKINLYATGTPSATTKLIGTNVDSTNETENFLVGDILALGSPEVDSSFKTLRSYGAIGDGVTDDTQAVALALASGLAIDGENLNYLLTSTVDIVSDTRLSYANFITDPGFTDSILLRAYGEFESGQVPTADINEGVYSINISDGTAYSEGDYIYVKSDAYWSDVALDDVKQGEVIRVKSVDGNTLNLDTPTLMAYVSGDSFSVNKFNPVKNVEFKEVSAIGIDSNLKFVEFKFCENIKVTGGKTQQFDNAHYSFVTTVNYIVQEAEMKGSGTYDGLNYGVAHIAASVNGRVVRCTGSALRHLSSIGGSQGVCRYIEVSNCIGTDMVDSGIDAHSAVWEHSFIDNNITLSDDSLPSMGGIYSAGGRPIIKGNRIFNARKDGILFQPLINSTITKTIELDAHNNHIEFNQASVATSYGVSIQTYAGSTRPIDRVNLSNITIVGGIASNSVYVLAATTSINNIIISNCQPIGTPASRGIHIRSQNATIENVILMGNQIQSGTLEGIYLQGSSTFGITAVIVSSNIIKDHSFGIRANYVTGLTHVGNIYLGAGTNTLIQNSTDVINLDS